MAIAAIVPIAVTTSPTIAEVPTAEARFKMMTAAVTPASVTIAVPAAPVSTVTIAVPVLDAFRGGRSL